MLTYADVERRAAGGDAESQELVAQVLEQAGRAGDAAGWLARAAAAGRLSALARLGLWRLVGFGLPAAPQAGVAEILQSAEAGDLFGMSLAATVMAGGVGAPRDAPAALRWLARAGEAGDGRAVCQLALLLGAHDPAAAAALLARAASLGFEPAKAMAPPTLPAAGAIDLMAAASAIDTSMFDAPPPIEEQRASPRIVLLPDLLPDWACDYVIALAAPVLTQGKVLGDAGSEVVSGVRTNSVMNFGLGDSDVVLELINQRLAKAAGLAAANGEGLGVLHYAPGEQYLPHVDYIPDTPANAGHLALRGQRVRTVLVYLNEGFEGGATEFVRLGLSFKPPRGWGLMFDSVTPQGAVEPLTLHRGAPPTRGEKWLISKWFRTKALRPTSAGGA